MTTLGVDGERGFGGVVVSGLKAKEEKTKRVSYLVSGTLVRT